MWWFILGGIALAFGIWVGLGWPGLSKGRGDRVVAPGRARRLQHRHLHWIRPQRRHR